MKDDMRDSLKQDFLNREGWGDAALSPLAGDASNRRYERVVMADRKAVLMDAPASRGEDISIYLAFTGYLRDLGLSAPEIYGADIEAGFALIEDLGDALYARLAAARPELEEEIYSAAVDLLPRLFEAPAFVKGGGAECAVQPYDMAVLLREAMLAPDWWAKGAGTVFSADLTAEYQALMTEACALVKEARDVLVLRDYHAENLLWLPERSGAARVGLLDYQDALAGSPAYDLVSLLEDARRDTSPTLQEAMIRRYLKVSGAEEEAFRAAYSVLGAQRNLKIIGIFARLWLRDGKPSYLALIPRVWAHLMRDLQHSALRDLAAFVHRHIPAPDEATLARVRGGM